MLSRSVYRESMTACTRVKPDKMPTPRMGIGHKVPALTKRLFAIDAKGKGYQFSSAACLWLYNHILAQVTCSVADGQHKMDTMLSFFVVLWTF